MTGRLLICCLVAFGGLSASAESDFPQKGIWACEETSKISGYDAVVQTEVTYPSPGKFHSKGVATLFLSTKREVRVSLTGDGTFTTDGEKLVSTYNSVTAKPLPSVGFSEAEADFLADWQAYLIRGFTSIEGRALDQVYTPKSDSAFDLIAEIGGRESVVSCSKLEDLIG